MKESLTSAEFLGFQAKTYDRMFNQRGVHSQSEKVLFINKHGEGMRGYSERAFKKARFNKNS